MITVFESDRTVNPDGLTLEVNGVPHVVRFELKLGRPTWRLKPSVGEVRMPCIVYCLAGRYGRPQRLTRCTCPRSLGGRIECESDVCHHIEAIAAAGLLVVLDLVPVPPDRSGQARLADEPSPADRSEHLSWCVQDALYGVGAFQDPILAPVAGGSPEPKPGPSEEDWQDYHRDREMLDMREAVQKLLDRTCV